MCLCSYETRPNTSIHHSYECGLLLGLFGLLRALKLWAPSSLETVRCALFGWKRVKEELPRVPWNLSVERKARLRKIHLVHGTQPIYCTHFKFTLQLHVTTSVSCSCCSVRTWRTPVQSQLLHVPSQKTTDDGKEPHAETSDIGAKTAMVAPQPPRDEGAI